MEAFAGAGRARTRRAPNLYGSDAARSRCVATRKRVADEARARIDALGDLSLLPSDISWEALVSSLPTIPEIEPDLDDEELDSES